MAVLVFACKNDNHSCFAKRKQMHFQLKAIGWTLC